MVTWVIWSPIRPEIAMIWLMYIYSSSYTIAMRIIDETFAACLDITTMAYSMEALSTVLSILLSSPMPACMSRWEHLLGRDRADQFEQPARTILNVLNVPHYLPEPLILAFRPSPWPEKRRHPLKTPGFNYIYTVYLITLVSSTKGTLLGG